MPTNINPSLPIEDGNASQTNIAARRGKALIIGLEQNEGAETATPESEPLDLVWGARAIARVLGKTTRATFHLLELGQIPARKVGSQWVVSRKVIRKLFEDETA